MFFTYCPLRCVYCQNATIAQGRAGKEVSVGQLADLCLDLQAQGALNVNFVTPTHYSLDVRDAIGIARNRGLSLPVVWNTSGYERVETLRALDGGVDVYLADFKYADAALAERYSHARDYPEVALKAIEEMVRQAGEAVYDRYRGQTRLVRGVVVRHLLLPGALGNSLAAAECLWEHFGDSVLYSFMNQYTPVMDESQCALFPELCEPASAQDYEALLDFADEIGMDDYFWQDGPTATESFIPAWDLTGV